MGLECRGGYGCVGGEGVSEPDAFAGLGGGATAFGTRDRQKTVFSIYTRGVHFEKQLAADKGHQGGSEVS